jgi:hypothetical protein
LTASDPAVYGPETDDPTAKPTEFLLTRWPLTLLLAGCLPAPGVGVDSAGLGDGGSASDGGTIQDGGSDESVPLVDQQTTVKQGESWIDAFIDIGDEATWVEIRVESEEPAELYGLLSIYTTDACSLSVPGWGELSTPVLRLGYVELSANTRYKLDIMGVHAGDVVDLRVTPVEPGDFYIPDGAECKIPDADTCICEEPACNCGL